MSKNMESRGINSAKYGKQGNYLSKTRITGELLHQNTESRGTLLAKYGEGKLLQQNTESREAI